jgi:hypothetical protein
MLRARQSPQRSTRDDWQILPDAPRRQGLQILQNFGPPRTGRQCLPTGSGHWPFLADSPGFLRVRTTGSRCVFAAHPTKNRLPFCHGRPAPIPDGNRVKRFARLGLILALAKSRSVLARHVPWEKLRPVKAPPTLGGQRPCLSRYVSRGFVDGGRCPPRIGRLTLPCASGGRLAADRSGSRVCHCVQCSPTLGAHQRRLAARRMERAAACARAPAAPLAHRGVRHPGLDNRASGLSRAHFQDGTSAPVARLPAATSCAYAPSSCTLEHTRLPSGADAGLAHFFYKSCTASALGSHS